VPEDEIDRIPFGFIAEDLRAGMTIPFLGAGASLFEFGSEFRPPSASALARELADEARFPDTRLAAGLVSDNRQVRIEKHYRARMDVANLSLVSSWVERVGGDRTRLQNKLRQYLANAAKPIQSNRLHRMLAHAASRAPLAIITTNYDNLMEKALDEHDPPVPYDLFVIAIERRADPDAVPGAIQFRPAGETVFRAVTAEEELLDVEASDDAGIRLNRTVVFKMHGHIDLANRRNDTFVITEEDYATFLGRMGSQNTLIPSDLGLLMQSRSFLFLGYGLRDWNFRVLFDRLDHVRGSAGRLRSFGIALDIEQAERDLWSTRNINIFNADLAAFANRLSEELEADQ